MSCQYFGTDGIRDVVGGPLMNEAFIRRLGFALGRYLEKKYPDQPRAIVIGYDTRESGPKLADTIMEGLGLRDTMIYNLGGVPTPAVAFALEELSAQMGIVLTASHNPAEYNGVKLFNAQGMKLKAEEEALVERFIDEARPPQDRMVRSDCYPHPFAEQYVNVIRSKMDKDCLAGWTIALDTANGATSLTTPAVLKHLGANVIGIGDAPNGRNINENVGSEHPEAMARLVVKHGAAMGVAHDGDGDRLIVADERGCVLDGDEVLGILALHRLSQRTLANKTLVTTLLSNKALDKAVEAQGGKVVRTDVGDRYVLYGMLEHGSNLGGEASGHIISMDYCTTGDGLIALLELIQVMIHTRKPLSELRQVVQLFPAAKKNLKIREKRPLESLKKLTQATKEVETALAGDGQVLVRYSGTEPKIRLHVEAATDEQAQVCLKMLVAAVEEDLEVLM